MAEQEERPAGYFGPSVYAPTAGPAGAPPAAAYSPPPRVRIEVIGEAWALLKAQMGVWVGAMAILLGFALGFYVVIFGVFAAVAGTASGPNKQPSDAATAVLFGAIGLGGLLIWLCTTYLTAGLYAMAIKQVRGEPIAISDMFPPVELLPTILGAMVLMTLAMLVAEVLCVIPMYIVGGLLMLTIPLIVDRRMGATEALTTSWNALKSDWVMAAAIFFLLPLVASLGMFACGIGVLVSLPMMYLGTALVYRDFFYGMPLPRYAGPYGGATAGAYPAYNTPQGPPTYSTPPSLYDPAPPAAPAEPPQAPPPSPPTTGGTPPAPTDQ